MGNNGRRASWMELSALLNDEVNVVDIYICRRADTNANPWVEVGWDKPMQVPSAFGKGTAQTIVEYHHRELCYVYDTSNDGQRVIKKTLLMHKLQGTHAAYAFVEEQLPSHRYPCVDETTHKQEIQRTTYRINNRLTFVMDRDSEFYYFYLRYQHAPNVDAKKMDADVKFALNQCRKALIM